MIPYTDDHAMKRQQVSSGSRLGAVALALGLLVAPAGALAQGAGRVPTVGILSAAPSSGAVAPRYRQAFEEGLKDFGWVPGQTIHLEYRYVTGGGEQLEVAARELGLRGVDVIVARSTASIRAAKRATATTPIVMSAAGLDPVRAEFIASMGRPGGNITGLSLLNEDLRPKQLQLLREIVPRLSRVGVLAGPSTEGPDQALAEAAAGLRVQLHRVIAARADDLDRVFAELRAARVNGLLVRGEPTVLDANTRRIVTLARQHRLPAVYWLRAFPEAGGLMSYGADLLAVHRRSAYYVDRLLRGARPADLPVEEPAKLALVVNVAAAAEIGLTLPPAIVARADEVLR